jgi:hypothetical protein
VPRTSDSSPRRLPLPVRVGLALFAAGLVFIAVDVVPFFLGDHNRPLWLNLACLLAPLGFAIAIGSTLLRARSEQRSVLREVTGA